MRADQQSRRLTEVTSGVHSRCAPHLVSRAEEEMPLAHDHDWLGRPLSRKSAGPFVFVQHHYPRLSQRQPHSHSWLHLVLVQRGHYRRTVGNRLQEYGAGSLSLLATEERHTDEYAPGTKCVHLVIPSSVEEQLAREFRVVGRRSIAPMHPVNAALAVAFYREFERMDVGSPAVLQALVTDLVSRELAIVVERTKLRPTWIARALEYLDAMHDRSWTLAALAGELGVHPVYLCRAFSKHVGVTVGEYVRTLRVLKACELLSTGHDGRMAEVAVECGFTDESHFSRAFKAAYGTSPARYRRLARQVSYTLPPAAR